MRARTSSNFVRTIDPRSAADLKWLARLREVVRHANGLSSPRIRVKLQGRGMRNRMVAALYRRRWADGESNPWQTIRLADARRWDVYVYCAWTTVA